MKTTLCASFLLWVSSVSAQIVDTVYLDAINMMVKNKTKASYMLISHTENKTKTEQIFDIKGNLLSISQSRFVKNWNSVKKDSVSKWLLHGNYTAWFANKNIKKKEQYYSGLRQGESYEFYPTGEILRKNIFQLGILQGSHFYYENGQSFLICEKGIELARLPNQGVVNMFLYKQFKPYFGDFKDEPNDVFIKFVIGIDGIPKDFRIINSTKRRAYKGMINVFRNLPRFIPAQRDNLPIETAILLPVTFGEKTFFYYSKAKTQRQFFNDNDIPELPSYMQNPPRRL